VYIDAPERLTAVKKIVTKPFPFIPTDMQPQLMAVMCTANGRTSIYETVFEARNKHITELKSMGANIEMTDSRHFVVDGVKKLHGAEVYARDLRGGASLILAGLGANGITKIFGSEHIERGYENIEEKLSGVGADIKYCC
jgi:UDP-N-acetylglucosamine 1-carboxyvinyltransferase